MLDTSFTKESIAKNSISKEKWKKASESGDV